MLSSPSKADPCGVPHMTLPSQPEDKPSSLTRQSEPGRMLDPYENTKAAHARARSPEAGWTVQGIRS